MTDRKVSTGAYAPDKALAHPYRLNVLRGGGQPYPVHVHFILSDLCNLNCVDEDGVGCAYRTPDYASNELFKVIGQDGRVNNNPNRMLETDLALSIIDDCVGMGVRAVQFTGGGEPLVHPDAARIIRRAQESGLETALVTNALNLHKLPRDVLTRMRWIRVSIDAGTEETFARVRPGLGGPSAASSRTNFHRVIDNLSEAVEHRDDAVRRGEIDPDHNRSLVIGAGFVVQKANWRELYEFARLCREIGVDNIRISGLFSPQRERYFEGWREPAEALERKVVADFHDPDGSRNGRPFSVYGRFHEKVTDLESAPSDPFCAYQNLTTYVGGDGNVYRCCNVAYNPHGLIGSIRDAGGFRALWDSQQKAERFAQFDARSCSYCQFVDKNKAINAVLAMPETPAAPDLVHENFV